MSTMPRILRFATALTLTSALLGALAAMPAPALASGEEGAEESMEESLGVATINPQEFALHVDPAMGTMFSWLLPTGETRYESAEELTVGIYEGETIDLMVRFYGTQGMVETSPDGEDTTLTATHRNKVWVELRPDSTTTKDYWLVFMDPNGQELPSLPKVKITTKSTQPHSPILHPGEAE